MSHLENRNPHASVTIYSIKPIINQYEVHVGPRCFRAHQVTIKFYHLVAEVKSNGEQRLPTVVRYNFRYLYIT